jgi:phosphoribosylaminoimidazolecarboxamide formyltransferase/IMP cyclohydrolase
MNKKIQSALISVFYKDGIDTLAKTLQDQGVKIYSTGGTQKFLEEAGIDCIAVESVTSYPSILGGRVKTLHPKVFGGILGRRDLETDLAEMKEHDIPELDLVIVDLYPFEETLANTSEEAKIIEKIDIGGPSMLRAAAKNFKDVCVIGSKDDYAGLGKILIDQNGETTLAQRKEYAARTFKIVTQYDIAIDNYFNSETRNLRYGENPHQSAQFIGNLSEHFEQLNGKELSYNNLVDVDAAVSLINEFEDINEPFFAVFKHTNVCGAAIRDNNFEAWKAALAGDPESAFGGVIITNQEVSKEVAEDMSGIFFEVLLAPSFSEDAILLLSKKKNRILLKMQKSQSTNLKRSEKTILGGKLIQDNDQGNYSKWEEVGAREGNGIEKGDLSFANSLCKHLKSNAIALVKDLQLIGKGCGQTSRIDALRHSIAKANQFEFNLHGAVLASDAFFPFDDCIKIAHEAGISAVIQPGGSIRDKDSVDFAKNNGMVMVMTGMRHFKH